MAALMAAGAGGVAGMARPEASPPDSFNPMTRVVFCSAGLALRLAELVAAGLLLAVLVLLMVCGVEPTTPAAPAAPEPASVAVVADAPAAPEPAPVAVVMAAPAIASAAHVARLTVAELRRQARAAGLPRALYRSGSRAALLEALGQA